MEQASKPSNTPKPAKQPKRPDSTPAVYETSKVKRQQYRFVNVFDREVTKPDQIVDTYLE